MRQEEEEKMKWGSETCQQSLFKSYKSKDMLKKPEKEIREEKSQKKVGKWEKRSTEKEDR